MQSLFMAAFGFFGADDTEKAREITVLKYYLYSKGVLAVSRDGALYINMDKTSGE